MTGISIQIDARVKIPTAYGIADFISFKGFPDNKEHFALQFEAKSTDNEPHPLVRIHSECITGDIFSSKKCDCGDQLHEALKLFSQKGGTLIYLRQEGRGIGLNQKLLAYQLQNQGLDTFEANRALGHKDDLRTFDAAVAILHCLKLNSIVLYSNNPEKEFALRKAKIDVKAVRRTGVYLKKENYRYLEAKQRLAGHRISLLGVAFS